MSPPDLRILKNDKAHNARDKARDEGRPLPSDDHAVAPEFLSFRAKQIFDDLVKKIKPMYEVSATDVDLLVLYANNHEMLEYLELILRKEGVTYTCTTKLGETMIKARPEVAMLQTCKGIEMKLLPEFGLSPNGRSKMNIKPKVKEEKKNPFAALG